MKIDSLEQLARMRPYVTPDGLFYTEPRVGKVVPYEGQVPSYPLTMLGWTNADHEVAGSFRAKSPVTDELMRMGLQYRVDYNSEYPTVMEYQQATVPDIEPGVLIKEGEDIFNPPPTIIKPLPLLVTSEKVGIHPTLRNVADASHRAGQTVEKMTLGLVTVKDEMGIPLYGLLNHPNRLTYSPPDFSESPTPRAVHIALYMRQKMFEQCYYGPFLLIHNKYDDWSTARRVSGVNTFSSEDMPKGQAVMVQVTGDVVQIIVAIDPTLIFYEGEYRVVCVIVPRIREDAYGKLGVIHCVA